MYLYLLQNFGPDHAFFATLAFWLIASFPATEFVSVFLETVKKALPAHLVLLSMGLALAVLIVLDWASTKNGQFHYIQWGIYYLCWNGFGIAVVMSNKTRTKS